MARVLVLGGVGFIGRNLVRYLAENNLASKILVADKVPPQVAGLNEAEKEVFNSDLVTFKQANLARDATIDAVFEHDGGNWEVVVNLCGATKYSQPPEVYQESTVEAARVCAAAAKKHGARRFVEVSTAQVYKTKKIPNDGWKENGDIDPWTGVARARYEAEQEVKKSGVDHVILRPAIVYGVGDTLGLTPKLVVGAIYKESKKTMKLLWSGSLKTNTVHVNDVCAAIWFVADNSDIPSGSVFNLADQNDTDQHKVNAIIEQLYGIKTDFLGKTKSSIASTLGKKQLTDFVNDKHLKPWSDLCKNRGILDTPLTPYLDEELLYNCPLQINGSAITERGFNYTHPAPNADLVRETLQDFIAKGHFPADLI